MATGLSPMKASMIGSIRIGSIWGESVENVSILGPGRIWGKGLVRSGAELMTAEENEASLLRSGSGPLEVVGRLHWLIVFINTNERHVDIEPRKIEIVRIAAKKRCLKLRNKN